MFISRFLILFLCFASGLCAQNVTIRGQADQSFVGKTIGVWRYTDYVTMSRAIEITDTVRADGSFALQFFVSVTEPVLLRVENVTAEMYAQPDHEYAVTFPAPVDERVVNKEVELPVTLGIVGTDSTELNALVFDFQHLYNSIFMPDDGRYLTRAMLFRRTDSLYRAAAARYSQIDDPFFKSYITYFIASVNVSLSRGEKFLISTFIQGNPIQYRHSEYMKFFNACFTGYFKTISSRYPGQSIFNIINTRSDYGALTAFLKREPVMASDSLRELVCLVNLWECYFSEDFHPPSVETVVSQLVAMTQIGEHRRIGRQMLAFMGRLQPGSQAPDFSARTKEGTMGSLAMFKGQWVYLNFFSTTNTSSLKEMAKIADLHKRYGNRMVFLSICVDDSLAAYERFLEKHPGYNWPIWFSNVPSLSKTAKDHYYVTGSEAYFFISNLGDIVQNPAVVPSEGIEYKFNTIFKIRQRTTRTGLR